MVRGTGVAIFLWLALGLLNTAYAQGAHVLDGRELMAKRLRFDPALTGTWHYGVYLNGVASMGTMKLTVAPAPKKTGAAYQVVMQVQMSADSNSMTIDETSLLDTSFALVSSTTRETELHDSGSRVETKILTRLGKKTWSAERSYDGKMESFRIKALHPHHGSMASMLLMIPQLDRSQAGVYGFHALEWPNRGEDGEQSMTWRPLELNIQEASEYIHRNETYSVNVIRGHFEGREVTNVVVSDQDEILAFWPDRPPVRMIRGSEEQVVLDLSVAEFNYKESDPRFALKTYFEVMAQVKGPDALDHVLDWASLRQDLAKAPGTEQGSADEYAESIKARLMGATAPIEPESVRLIMALLEVQIEEDHATIRVEGREGTFKLKKHEAGWRIIGFPQ